MLWCQKRVLVSSILHFDFMDGFSGHRKMVSPMSETSRSGSPNKCSFYGTGKTREKCRCHLSTKKHRFPDKLPRCQAPSANRFSHIIWRGIVKGSFFILHLSSRSNLTACSPKYMEDAPGNA